LVVLGIAIMVGRGNGSSPAAGTEPTATTTAPPSSLPPGLDSALSDLDAAVHHP
jgi:hypothetical protein